MSCLLLIWIIASLVIYDICLVVKFGIKILPTFPNNKAEPAQCMRPYAASGPGLNWGWLGCPCLLFVPSSFSIAHLASFLLLTKVRKTVSLSKKKKLTSLIPIKEMKFTSLTSCT